MPNKRIAALIAQEVQQPTKSADNSAIATTQNTPLAELKLTNQGLFGESKALWDEFVAFDKEHQLTQRVGSQIWRLTKAIGKPALVLSLKGIQAAVITVVNPENRAALVEHFSRFRAAQATDASLETLEN
jgi:hypothetical protein